MADFFNLDATVLLGLVIGLVSLGAVAGFLSGLLGVGGGIVLVPGLFFVFQLLGFTGDHIMHMAVGTSLSIIIPTGFMSARAHYRKGVFQKDLFSHLGRGIVPGVILGTIFADYISGNSLRILFASIMMALSFVMFVDLSKRAFLSSISRQPWFGLYGFISGCISTLIGIGGATLNVPFMVLCNVPVHRAVGTAAALGLIISIPAMIGFVIIGLNETNLPPFSLGYVNYLAFLVIIPMSMLFAPLGASAAHRVSIKNLRKIFGIFMILVALKMWGSIWKFL
tara:strand:- start:2813 stop:3655 length:843 start_codon:yes stop_codon:yes gene_type:complete